MSLVPLQSSRVVHELPLIPARRPTRLPLAGVGRSSENHQHRRRLCSLLAPPLPSFLLLYKLGATGSAMADPSSADELIAVVVTVDTLA